MIVAAVLTITLDPAAATADTSAISISPGPPAAR
jgi:hypothetical protein